MQSLAAAWRQATILRQPALLNMSKRLAWRWVEEPTDNDAIEPEKSQINNLNILNKNSQQLDKDSKLSTTKNSSKIGEALRGEYRAKVDVVKTENNALLAKLDSLQVLNDGLQARVDTMEQKLKVAEHELGTKLTKQDVNNLVAEKVTEVTGQLREEFRREDDDEDEESDEEEEDSDEEDSDEENSDKKEKEESSQADEDNESQRKQPQLLQNFSIEVDGENHWNAKNFGKMSFTTDRLTVTNKVKNDLRFASVRSMKPFSLVASNLTRVFYFEVLAKQLGHLDVGLSGPDFPVENNKFCVGQYPGSYSYCTAGRVYKANIIPTSIYSYEQIDDGDTVGCGLIQMRGKIKIFFTKNGLFNGKPILLPFALDEQKYFYPTVSLQDKGTVMEANFGANPFKYNFASLGAMMNA